MYNATNKPILFTEYITIPLQNKNQNHSLHSGHEFYIQNVKFSTLLIDFNLLIVFFLVFL